MERKKFLKNNYDVINKREKMFHLECMNPQKKRSVSEMHKQKFFIHKSKATSKTTYMNERMFANKSICCVFVSMALFLLSGWWRPLVFEHHFGQRKTTTKKCLLVIWQAFFYILSISHNSSHIFTHNVTAVFSFCLVSLQLLLHEYGDIVSFIGMNIFLLSICN